MGKLLDLISKFEKLDIGKVSEDSLNEVAPDIEQHQRQQLLEGKSSTGGIIGRYRSQSYAALKHAISPLAGFGNVDLTLTRSFANQLKAYAFGASLIIESYDAKAPELEAKYGGDMIYGLNKEHKGILVNEKLRPVVMGNIRKIIRL